MAESHRPRKHFIFYVSISVNDMRRVNIFCEWHHKEWSCESWCLSLAAFTWLSAQLGVQGKMISDVALNFSLAKRSMFCFHFILNNDVAFYPCIHQIPIILNIFRWSSRRFSLLLYRFSAFWLRSKCSICSYQFNIWYVASKATTILIWFLDTGKMPGACSALATGRPGIAVLPGVAQ